MSRAVDDVSSVSPIEPPVPAIVMVAIGVHAASLVLVRPDDLAAIAGMPLALAAASEPAADRPRSAIADIDREAVANALARANNVVSVAARALGCTGRSCTA